MLEWRLGTMGFSYAEWAGVFYPRGMKAGEPAIALSDGDADRFDQDGLSHGEK